MLHNDNKQSCGSLLPPCPMLTEVGRRKRARSPAVQPLHDEKPSRLTVLPPPIVADYAPYGKGQLRDLWKRQSVKTCAVQWDSYYTNNTINGYKDRHYLLREFHELRIALDTVLGVRDDAGEVQTPLSQNAAMPSLILVEVGCGVGNAVIPIIEAYRELPPGTFEVYGFDISRVAVRLLLDKVEQSRSTASPTLSLDGRLHAIPHDLAEAPLDVGGPDAFMPRAADFATIIFVLCSVPAHKQAVFVDRVASLVAAGGVVFIRDYAAGDLAEERYQFNNRSVDAQHFGDPTISGCEGEVDKNESAAAMMEAAAHSTYIRSNGTLSCFFTKELMVQLFVSTGKFEVIDVEEVVRDVENRKEGIHMTRKFIQGRFRRRS